MLNIVLIIFEQTMIYLPLVLGAYISFSLLKIPDLSLETSYLIGAFSGSCALHVMQGTTAPFSCIVTVCGALLGGGCVGLLASCITFYANISHLLSSIIIYGLFQGLFLMVSAPYISLAKYDNVLMHLPFLTHHPELLTLMLINAVIVIFFWCILQTQLGYSFAIFGHNALFFKYFNISTSYVFISGVVFAHALSGLAGFLFAQTNSLVEMNMGVGKALFCITALILGNAIVASRKQSLVVPVVGIAVYFSLQHMLLACGFNLKYFTMIQALLIFIILITVYKKNNFKSDQLGL